MASGCGAFLVLLLLLPACAALIPDGRWRAGLPAPHEEAWTRLTGPDEGQATDCVHLGSLTLSDPAVQFPLHCHSRATVLGSDTFDVEPDLSQCHFKRCGSYADIRFRSKAPGSSSYTTLTGVWRQILRAIDGHGVDCGYLGSYSPDATDFLAACERRGAVLGADTFDAKADKSSCYFKRCASFSNVRFTDRHGSYDSFTILGGDFHHITLAVHGVGLDCKYLGRIPALPANSSDAPISCISPAVLKGADSFDVAAGYCYLKKCGSLADMAFTDKYGPHDSYSMLGALWSQATRASDGLVLNCPTVGSMSVSVADFPSACYSRAMVLGSDALEADLGAGQCHFKHCGSADALKFASSPSGRECHSRLLGVWAQITAAHEGVSSGCDYLGSYEPSSTDFPQACFARGLSLGANTLDARAWGSPACYFKKCSRYGDFKLTDKYGPHISYTTLFPRGDGWGICDPATCLDLHILYTGHVNGRHLPVTSAGTSCDPEESSMCFGGAARRVAYHRALKQEVAQRNESLLLLELGGSSFGGPFWDHPGLARGMASTLLQNLIPYDFCAFSDRDFLTNDDDVSRRELVEAFSNRTCKFVLSTGRFQGMWSGFNAKTVQWSVKEMVNGWKVAFVGLFPYVSDRAYRFGNKVIDLDSRSLLESIFDGSVSLTIDENELRDKMTEYEGQYYKLQSSLHDVVTLSTMVPVDLLAAAGEAKRAHPDVKATILMATSYHRDDTIRWLVKHGDFDIILRSTEDKPWLGRSIVSGKQVLVAGSETVFGLGHVKVRLKQGSGVDQFQATGDFALDSGVPSDPATLALMSELYEVIRARVARPFGQITNPLTGGHRGGESPPSMMQCYYTDCPAGKVVGEAILWRPRSQRHKADLSFYNMGGFRSPLAGDANQSVSLQHCTDTLKFQNFLKLFEILGRDFYNLLKVSMVYKEERGLLGAGFRVAFHEPCWQYVNHSNYDASSWDWSLANPPGTAADLQRCRDVGGVDDPAIKIIDVEVKHVLWEKCEDYTSCEHFEWRPLQKGATYTLVSTDFLASAFKGFVPLDITFDTDAQTLCDYLAAKSPLQVEGWQSHRDRGNVQFPDARSAWDVGARIASVATPVSDIEAASTCPEGMYLPVKATSCKPCRAGTHSEEEFSLDGTLTLVCRDCSRGFFSNSSGQSSCSPCAAGRYSISTGSTVCADCPAGEISEVAASKCTSCFPGTFTDGAASSLCKSCPVGSFADAARSTACTPCGASLVTQYPAATSREHCACPQGRYWPASADVGLALECQLCKEGMECPLGSNISNVGRQRGGAVQFPYLLPLHWSSRARPLSVFACSSQRKCPGGDPGTCGPGLREVQACEHCQGAFYWDGTGCRACRDNKFLWPVLPVLASPPMVVLLYMFTKAPLEDWSTWTGAISVLCYIVLGHYQILNLLGSMVQELPGEVNSLITFWTWSNNLFSVFEPHCLGFISFRARILTASLVPVAFVCMALLTMTASWLCSRCLKKPKWHLLFDGVHNVIGNFVFTFFSGIVGQALTIFKCAQNPNGLRTMKADRSITCYDDEEWQSMLVVGVASAVLYCAVIMALYARTIYVASRNENFKNAGFQWRWKFLFVKFRPDVYWFGMVILVKNMLINVGPVMFRTNMGVLYWVTGVIVVYAGFVINFMPFRYRTANFLELVVKANLVMCCSFLLTFSEPPPAWAKNIVSKVLLSTSFLPMIGLFPSVAFIIWREVEEKRRGARRSELEEQFWELQHCCFALAQMPVGTGVEMLHRVGEADRHLFRRFSELIRSVVFGAVTGRRLTTGATSTALKDIVLSPQSQATYLIAHVQGPTFCNVKMCI